MQKVNMIQPGQRMPLRQRFISRCVQLFYFNSVNLLDSRGQPLQPLAEKPPTLFYVSHRNGAIDGYVVQKLHAAATSMVSIQLTQHPYLKWFFSGIPVLREKDVKRYGDEAKGMGNPILNSIRHVEAGGSICIYPEGSSEWGYTHLPYHEGGAKIIRHLLQKGQIFQVRAVGLFYAAPDQFRSDVDVVVSDPIMITPQAENESAKAWEARIFEQMNVELDSISVHCRDEEHFETVSKYAEQMQEQEGGFYGAHFIKAQQQNKVPQVPIQSKFKRKWYLNLFSLFCSFCFVLMMFPVLWIGWLAGKKADAKNTVTFFRIMAATPLVPVWLIILSILVFLNPVLVVMIPFAATGLKTYAVARAFLSDVFNAKK